MQMKRVFAIVAVWHSTLKYFTVILCLLSTLILQILTFFFSFFFKENYCELKKKKIALQIKIHSITAFYNKSEQLLITFTHLVTLHKGVAHLTQHMLFFLGFHIATSYDIQYSFKNTTIEGRTIFFKFQLQNSPSTNLFLSCVREDVFQIISSLGTE